MIREEKKKDLDLLRTSNPSVVEKNKSLSVEKDGKNARRLYDTIELARICSEQLSARSQPNHESEDGLLFDNTHSGCAHIGKL